MTIYSQKQISAHLYHYKKKSAFYAKQPWTDIQGQIIASLLAGNHVIVEAYPGSGKTSVARYLSDIHRHLKATDKILLLTYNKRLSNDTLRSIRVMKLEPYVECRTLHSMANAYYDRNAMTNNDLIRIVVTNKPLVSVPMYKYIILDEIQDMSLELYGFVHKLFRDLQASGTLSDVQLLIMGDQHQCVFEFTGADSRFLSLAKEVWQTPLIRAAPFVEYTMSGTNRFGAHTCEFLNRHICPHMSGTFHTPIVSLKSEREQSPGLPVIMLSDSQPIKMADQIVAHIRRLIDDEGHSPCDIFILAGTVNHSAIVDRVLEAVGMDYPCYRQTNDEGNTDDTVIENKLAVFSYHSSKGRERPFVFVIDLDTNPGHLINGNRVTEMHNAHYVGLSRCTKQLYVCETHNYNEYRPAFPHPTLHENQMAGFHVGTAPEKDYVKMGGGSPVPEPVPEALYEKWKEKKAKASQSQSKKISPTELSRFCPSRTEYVLGEMAETMLECVVPAGEVLEFPPVVDGMRINNVVLREEVDDISGLSLPAICHNRLQKGACVLTHLYSSLVDKLNTMFVTTNTSHFERRKTAKLILKRFFNIDVKLTSRYESARWDEYVRRTRLNIHDNADFIPKPPAKWKPHHYNMICMLEKALTDGTTHRLRQIIDYSWFDQPTLEQVCARYKNEMQADIEASTCCYPALEYELFGVAHVRLRKLPYEPHTTASAPIRIPTPEKNEYVADSFLTDPSCEFGAVSDSDESDEDWDEDIAETPAKECVEARNNAIQQILWQQIDKLGGQNTDWHWFTNKNGQEIKTQLVLGGRADYVSDHWIVEFKNTSSLTVSHKSQLIFYAWAWTSQQRICAEHPEWFTELEQQQLAFPKKYRLFNLKTGEVFQLRDTVTEEELTLFVAKWADGKHRKNELSQLTDEEFLAKCADAREGRIGL